MPIRVSAPLSCPHEEVGFLVIRAAAVELDDVGKRTLNLNLPPRGALPSGQDEAANLTETPLLTALRELAQPGIPPALRTMALRREHWICRYCGARATEVDHVLPRAQGGLTTLSNLAASCQLCNRQKGNQTPEQWEAAKQRRAAQIVALRNRLQKPRGRPLVKSIPQRKPTLAELLEASRSPLQRF